MSTVGEYFDSTLVRGIDEGIGAAGLVQSLHGTPRDGELELMTGTRGATGAPGPAARAFRWEGDIADQAALTAVSRKLGPAHAGKAWRVRSSDTLMYWNGVGFESFAEAFGAMGPDGQTCTVTIGTVETMPVGSPLEVTVTGTAPALTLHLKVPRGVKGRKGEMGPPGPLRQASDYADGVHSDRMVPMWDAAAGKWTPRPFPGLRGPWSIVEDRAWDGGPGFAASQNNVGASPNTVAQLQIPAQDTDWRPVIAGGAIIRTTEAMEDFTTRVDLEVRIGSAGGQIVALGSGFNHGIDSFNRFQPFFGVNSMTPASSVGVIPKGQAATLYVVLRRNQGGSNYVYSRPGAYITCWAQPVVTP